MKPSIKNKLKEVFLELLGEILIGAVAFAIGLGVLHLFKREWQIFEIDPDLVVLVGFLAVAAVTLIAVLLIHAIKRRKTKEDESPSNEKELSNCND